MLIMVDQFIDVDPRATGIQLAEQERVEALAESLSASTFLPVDEFIGYEVEMLAEADAWVGVANQIAAKYDPDSTDPANSASIVFEIPLGARVIKGTRGSNGFLTATVKEGELYCDLFGSEMVRDWVFVMNVAVGLREPFNNNAIGRERALELHEAGVFNDVNIKRDIDSMD